MSHEMHIPFTRRAATHTEFIHMPFLRVVAALHPLKDVLLLSQVDRVSQPTGIVAHSESIYYSQSICVKLGHIKGTMKISLMPSSGMHSKFYSASLHILCDLLAGPHPLFLNAHSINQLGVETTGLSIAFHASPG